MPFCLTNAPAVWINLMNKVFYKQLNEFVSIFVDDILIYFDNEELHEKHVRMVLEVLRENQLYAKFSKCDFWFLGDTISKNGVVVDLAEAAAVMEWKQ